MAECSTPARAVVPVMAEGVQDMQEKREIDTSCPPTPQDTGMPQAGCALAVA